MLDVTDRDKRAAGPGKNKKAACDPVGDSHAADKGYVAKTRP